MRPHRKQGNPAHHRSGSAGNHLAVGIAADAGRDAARCGQANHPVDDRKPAAGISLRLDQQPAHIPRVGLLPLQRGAAAVKPPRNQHTKRAGLAGAAHAATVARRAEHRLGRCLAVQVDGLVDGVVRHPGEYGVVVRQTIGRNGGLVRRCYSAWLLENTSFPSPFLATAEAGRNPPTGQAEPRKVDQPTIASEAGA